MGNDPDQIVVAANGSVWVAPLATTEPADILEAIADADPAWVELGYVTEDGATFTDSKDLTPINVWQSFYPARRIVTGKDATVAFELVQWNGDTVALAFGGGTITEPSPGAYRYTPPDPETIDERAMILEWLDGDYTYRLILGRGMVTESVETQLVRSGSANLPITFGVNGQEGVPPWYFDTDDPAFTPAGS